MPKQSKSALKQHIEYHKDGSVWAKGQTSNGVPVGHWEWFRKDGSRLRSGTFDDAGNQTGEWTTYDRQGAPYKVTNMSRKSTRRT
jgi:antitoxin component YwqK of YwqJK toxin-antitoxin module